jgi:hypothetical protein
MIERGSLLEEIRQRRQTTVEVIVIATVLGLVVNLAASAIFSFVWPPGSQSLSQLVIWPLSVVVVLLGGLSYVALRPLSEAAEVELLLPLVVRVDEAEVLVRTGYDLTKYASLFFTGTMRTDSELRKQFIESRQRDGFPEHTGGQDKVRDILYDLVQRLILALIDRYGEHTLTPAARYHPEYRPLAPTLESYDLPVDGLPAPLRENSFLRLGREGKQPQNIRLPATFVLAVVPSAFRQQSGKFDIALVSPSGTIRFVVLPYWRRVPEEARRYKIFVKGLPNGPKDLALIQIPMRVEVSVKGARLWAKSVDTSYLWMHGLMADSRRYLDWADYEQGDLERMVVDLSRGLARVEESLEALSKFQRSSR